MTLGEGEGRAGDTLKKTKRKNKQQRLEFAKEEAREAGLVRSN